MKLWTNFHTLKLGYRGNQCVPEKSFCNGIYDCLDRSDEANCHDNVEYQPEISYGSVSSVYLYHYSDHVIWSNTILMNHVSEFVYRRFSITPNLSANVLIQTLLIKQCQEGYDVINDLIPCSANGDLGLGLSNEVSYCIPYSFWCSYGENNVSKMHSLICPSFKNLFHNKEFCQNITFWDGRPCEKNKIRCNGKFIGRCSFKRCICSDNPMCLSHCLDKSQYICPIDSQKCQHNDYWTCQDNTTCVLEELVCDGFEHCPDGSDETQVIILHAIILLVQ